MHFIRSLYTTTAVAVLLTITGVGCNSEPTAALHSNVVSDPDGRWATALPPTTVVDPKLLPSRVHSSTGQWPGNTATQFGVRRHNGTTGTPASVYVLVYPKPESGNIELWYASDLNRIEMTSPPEAEPPGLYPIELEGHRLVRFDDPDGIAGVTKTIAETPKFILEFTGGDDELIADILTTFRTLR